MYDFVTIPLLIFNILLIVSTTYVQPQEVLQKYIDKGIVEYRDMEKSGEPGGQARVQIGWLNRCLGEIAKEDKFKDDGIRWVMLNDADEFVYPTADDGLTLSQVMEQKYNQEECLRMHRLTFGSSYWLQRPEEGLMIQNYLLRAPLGQGNIAIRCHRL